MSPRIPSSTGSWFDYGYGIYDAYPGYQAEPLRDHDKILLDAMYAYWSRTDDIAYQYLADCYNEFVRKEDEPILLPPPSYL